MSNRRARGAFAVAILVVVVAATGCSQSVHLRTQTPGAMVVVDDQDLGTVDPGGVQVEIPLGTSPVPFSLTKNGKTFNGEILRTETNIPLVLLGVGASVLLVPACTTTACLVANPFVAPALFLSFSAVGASGLVAALAGPSWVTLPCLMSGIGIGMSPMLLLTLAKKTPEQVVLGPVWNPRKGGAAPERTSPEATPDGAATDDAAIDATTADDAAIDGAAPDGDSGSSTQNRGMAW